MTVIENPYLTEYQQLPHKYPDVSVYALRKDLFKKYAWAIPTPDIINRIVQFAPRIVEIGAGTGYWESLLADAGADIVAYDIAPCKNDWCDGQWFDVQPGGTEMAVEHHDRALFLCWPPYDETMAIDALNTYKGRAVIYIGEGSGGCTGDDRFHERLRRFWKEVDCFPLEQWDGLHDYLCLYRRKRP